MLTIALLGPPDIRVNGVPMAVDTRKATAILAYLAVERGEHPRDTLVDLLWPDTDVDRARSSLRRTLSTLRSALGGRWIDADRSFVSLDRTDVETDVVAFTELASDLHGHDAATTCPDCRRDLGRAAALHRGEFLAGLHLRGAAPFEEWTTVRGEQFRRQADDVYARLATAHAREGDYAAAIASTERRIALDDLNEDAHRTLMLLSAWSGNRSGAVDVYRRLVGTLDTELGVPPLEETTELYEAILEEDLPHAPAPPRRSTPRRATRFAPAAPLVGREEPLARAVDALTDAGGILVVRGMPGVGVSRFLGEVGHRLRADGARVLAAAGTAAAAAVPYGVIHEAMATVVDDDDLRPAREALPAGVLAEASRLFPGIATGVPPAVDSATRTRFLDALTRLVGAVPDPVLVIDDAQRCDAASAEAIVFIATRAARIGARVVIGVSGGDTDHASVSAMIADISRRGVTVALEPLTRAQVAEVAAALAEEADVDALLAQSGGLPFFVVEALRPGPTEAGIPDEIRRVVADRVAGLDGSSRQVLEAAVVLGRPTPPGLVAAVSGRSPEETDRALDTLASRALICEMPDGTVAVGHDYLSMVVSDAMTAARRRLLHRRAAEASAARDGSGHPAHVARHHLSAGDDAKAATWFARAGDEAVAVFAYTEALANYESALAAGHPDRALLHRSMAHTAMLEGRYDRALAEYESALAAGDPDVAGIEHRMGEIHRRLRRWDLAAARHQRAAELASDDELRAIATADHAYVDYHRGESASAAELVAQALDLAQASGSDRALARAENVAGLLAADVPTRIIHLRVALDHATDQRENIAVLNNLAAVAAPEEAVTLARRALELALDLGDRHLMAALHNSLADALHAVGEDAESMAALTDAVSLFTSITDDTDDPWVPEVWLLNEW